MRKNQVSEIARYLRFVCATSGGVLILLTISTYIAHAQRVKDAPVKVTNVKSESSGQQSVISISADGNLTRAQTWQDADGKFHIILPKGTTDLSAKGMVRGVKMERVGNSLEIVLDAKPGANVTVRPGFNRLDLIVNGGLQESSSSAQSHATPKESPARVRHAPTSAPHPSAAQRAARPTPSQRENSLSNFPATPARAPWQGAAVPASPSHNSQISTATVVSPAVPDSNIQAPNTVTLSVPASAPREAPVERSDAPGDPASAARESSSAVLRGIDEKNVFYTPAGWLSVILVGGIALVFVRRRFVKNNEELKPGKSVKRHQLLDKLFRIKNGRKTAKVATGEAQFFSPSIDEEPRRSDERPQSTRRVSSPRASAEETELEGLRPALRGPALEKTGHLRERKLEGRSSFSAVPAVLFGAYRIEQEVHKLAEGQAHSIDVLASRALDDRRAIETSLIKALRASEASEQTRRRVSTALEEYGFVARLSASLLLATEAFDRSAAARALGEVKSTSAMPFLLEGLYDPEPIVRAEVVASLGALGLPKAIGALLDMARRYPEMPAALVGAALDSCSFESMDLNLNAVLESPGFTIAELTETQEGEIIGLAPIPHIEQLPEWLDDEMFSEALERLNSPDIEERTAAAHLLAQFQVQTAVDALAAMARNDESPTVRAMSVTSLGTINHESVFAHVVIAMGDEAREVRAAAARSLSRLDMDRADAYVRVIEMRNAAVLRDVAKAAIKAGLVAQAVDRLTSEDRRQAYEAFTLLSLVTKAGECAPLLDAIEHHGDLEVRFAAIRLLAMMGQPSELVMPLRLLATRGNIPRKLSVALLEAVQRIEQTVPHQLA